MIRRVAALVRARNLEFLRDPATLGWNIVLPVLLVIGFAILFGGEPRPLFKVAVVAPLAEQHHPFLEAPWVQFFEIDDVAAYQAKVGRHQVDMLIDFGAGRYWLNPDSPKGTLLQGLLAVYPELQAQVVSGHAVRYVDWLLPGILGMNIMFSCLFGVGYVIVRYRKNGYLKRLNATPVRALDFILAQILSRLMLILAVTTVVYIGTDLVLGFHMEGRYLDLMLLTVTGCASMIAMGLLVAARVTSEELAGGLLNLVSWPMMVLSEVWFSLEGSPAWVQRLAEALPLTHLLRGARAIMLEGAGLSDIRGHLIALAVIGLTCLAAGAASFRWK